MFDGLKDMYLKHHVKQKTVEFYSKYGLTMEQVERMTMEQLYGFFSGITVKLEKGIEMLQEQAKETAKIIEKQNTLIDKLVSENEKLELKNLKLEATKDKEYTVNGYKIDLSDFKQRQNKQGNTQGMHI